MEGYLVSHNGLGDNLYMIGALNFLAQFYKHIYFLCKNIYYDNVKLFFDCESNISCIPFNEHDEFNEIIKITLNKYNDPNIDIFICGPCHKRYLCSKITNKNFLNHKIINKNYIIDWDTLTSTNYSFIEGFYKDIKLNLTYFYEYFNLPSSNESVELYKSVCTYYIIFIQSKCSDGITLNISKLINKYINDDNALLMCNDNNLYKDFSDKNEKNNKKYKLAQQFVNNKIINYVDTIKNSDEIYLIDSCFIGIVLPFLKTQKLKTKKIRIILRNDAHKYLL